MKSKIKRFSNFISQIPQKHTIWETKAKSHQNIPMNLWDSNHSNQTFSLFLSFFLSQISEELEWNCVYPLKERKMLIKEIEEISLRKHDNYQDFERKNSIYVVRLNLTTHTKHIHSASFREKMNEWVWESWCPCVLVCVSRCVSGCVWWEGWVRENERESKGEKWSK